MPIYAFACDACGHAFDRLQKLSDADPTDCPVCGVGAVRRQLTAPQFRLAGGGWYETDFKKDGDKKRNLAGDGAGDGKPDAAPKPESQQGSKQESKPEKKPDTKVESKTASETKPAAPAASIKPASP